MHRVQVVLKLVKNWLRYKGNKRWLKLKVQYTTHARVCEENKKEELEEKTPIEIVL